MDSLIRKELTTKSKNIMMINRYIKFVMQRNGNGSVRHHILPKAKDAFPEYESLTRHKWNCSLLTEREHFVAHWMLWKILGGSQTFAFYQMKNKNKERINSRTYELLLQEVKKWHGSDEQRVLRSYRAVELHKKRSIGMYGKTQTSNQKTAAAKAQRGRKKGEMEIAKWRDSYNKTISSEGYVNPNLGIKRSEETKRKISENHHDVSGSNNPMYGRRHKPETIEKLKAKAKKRKREKCPYCPQIVTIQNYKRWHGDNCKHKQ